MPASATSADLRQLANVLDALAHITNTTGTRVDDYYGSQRLRLSSDLHIKITWVPTTEEQPGYYTVELEDT